MEAATQQGWAVTQVGDMAPITYERMIELVGQTAPPPVECDVAERLPEELARPLAQWFADRGVAVVMRGPGGEVENVVVDRGRAAREAAQETVSAHERARAELGPLAAAAVLEPVGDRLIVAVEEEDSVRASGIVVPDMAKEKPQRGRVLSVGPGRYEYGLLVPMTVKPGDVVLYSKYGGTELKVGEFDVLVLREADVLAIVRSG